MIQALWLHFFSDFYRHLIEYMLAIVNQCFSRHWIFRRVNRWPVVGYRKDSVNRTRNQLSTPISLGPFPKARGNFWLSKLLIRAWTPFRPIVFFLPPLVCFLVWLTLYSGVSMVDSVHSVKGIKFSLFYLNIFPLSLNYLRAAWFALLVQSSFFSNYCFMGIWSVPLKGSREFFDCKWLRYFRI